MAEYSFEASASDSYRSGLEIAVDRFGVWKRLGDPFGEERGKVRYDEQAWGRLTISDIEDREAEALKKGMLVTLGYNADLHGVHYPIFSDVLVVEVDKRLHKMQEIEDGTFSTDASLRRKGSVVIHKSGELKSGLSSFEQLNIKSYHANLARVYVAAVSDLRADFGEDRTGVAHTAQRMEREILEVVVPQLVAVHGLTVATLAARAEEIAA